MTAAIEVDGQSRPRGIRYAAELLGQSLGFCTVEPAKGLDRHRAVARGILGTDGVGLVHGGTCRLDLATIKLPSARLTER